MTTTTGFINSNQQFVNVETSSKHVQNFFEELTN